MLENSNLDQVNYKIKPFANFLANIHYFGPLNGPVGPKIHIIGSKKGKMKGTLLLKSIFNLDFPNKLSEL